MRMEPSAGEDKVCWIPVPGLSRLVEHHLERVDGRIGCLRWLIIRSHVALTLRLYTGNDNDQDMNYEALNINTTNQSD